MVLLNKALQVRQKKNHHEKGIHMMGSFKPIFISKIVLSHINFFLDSHLKILKKYTIHIDVYHQKWAFLTVLYVAYTKTRTHPWQWVFFLLSRLEFCTAVVSSFQTAPSPFDSVGRCVSFSAFYCCIQYTYQHVFGPFVQVAGASELVCSIATLMINAATYAWT